MEPFGLLNFIKSALSAAQTPPLSPSEDGGTSYAPTQPLSSVPSAPSAAADKTTEKTAETGTKNVGDGVKVDAFLSFCEQHEQRAKRLRK